MKYNQSQWDIIQDSSPYIQVVAGAGAGKTSTMIGILDSLLVSGSFPADKCLVLTFSRKATREFQERLEAIHPSNPIRIQTFHAYCLSVLNDYSPLFQDKKAAVISEKEKSNFFKEFFKSHKYRVGGIPYKYLMQEENPFLPIVDPELWEIAQKEWENFKSKEGKLEFKDLVRMFLESLVKNEKWTEIPKEESRFIIVDEFQDTDWEQLEFLRQMDPERLVVVGDDWQAIYGFRGATPRPFLELESYFSPLKKHFLTTNYRSYHDIVDVSKIPIHKNSEFIQKKMQSFRKGKAELDVWRLPDGKKGVEIATDRILKFVSAEEDYRILCRTNFRINEFKLYGIPEENLMTIHASKGLEFHRVFVDLMDGWNHNLASLSPENWDEERRILYVALSRAKDSLHILGRNDLKPDKRLEDEFLRYFIKRKIPQTKPSEI